MKLRKIAAISICLIFMVGLSAAFAGPTRDDAHEAFAVTFEAYIVSLFTLAFGQPVAGANMVTEDQVTFSSMPVADMVEEPGTYQTMSGTVTASEDGGTSRIEADLTLTGGPVHSVQWIIEDFNIEREDWTIDLTADGVTYHYEASEFE